MNAKGHSIYYEVYGKLRSTKTPLLVLHGGPGSSHNYLLPLARLSKFCPIIFYDQLGNGRSQIPVSDKYYTKEHLTAELEEVIKQLKLKTYHLYGHSWGGMLALEYMRKQRPNVETLILASSLIDSKMYTKGTQALLRKLNKDYPKVAREHEMDGTTGSQEYQKLEKKFGLKHLYARNEWPKEYRSFKFNTHQYNKMWGPSEMSASGTLINWSRLDVLPKIKQRTLVISGELDEVTPEQNKLTTKLVPDAISVIIPGGTHCAHVEKPRLYIKELERFLKSATTT